MDESKPVRWKKKPYLVEPCSSVPGYYYLTDVAGTKFFVPESELENMDDLVAVVDWIHAKDDGSNYRLEGDSAKLKEFFGHEIEVAGTIGGSAASSSSSQSKDNTQTIQVLDVKDLSSGCKSGR